MTPPRQCHRVDMTLKDLFSSYEDLILILLQTPHRMECSQERTSSDTERKGGNSGRRQKSGEDR